MVAEMSEMREAREAPKDGTMILGAFGWPWLVPAVWDDDSGQWVVTNMGAETLEDGTESRYWEGDTEQPGNLLGWMPWPELPDGYVSRSLNQTKEWYEKSAEIEGDSEIGAGVPPWTAETIREAWLRNNSASTEEVVKQCAEFQRAISEDVK